MAKCNKESVYCENGQEWHYFCALEEGHTEVLMVPDASGHLVAVTIHSDHDYRLPDGVTPPEGG